MSAGSGGVGAMVVAADARLALYSAFLAFRSCSRRIFRSWRDVIVETSGSVWAGVRTELPGRKLARRETGPERFGQILAVSG